MIGLLLMMWRKLFDDFQQKLSYLSTAVLTKIKYECLGRVLSSKRIWLHMAISFVLNWIVAPFIMLGLAWATLPEASLERERKGVLLIGVGEFRGY